MTQSTCTSWNCPTPEVSWFKRAAIVPLAVVNRGNRRVEVELRGASSPRECRFVFAAPSNESWRSGTCRCSPTKASMSRYALNYSIRHLSVCRYAKSPSRSMPRTQGQNGQSAAVVARTRTQLLARPLIGPWQFVIASGLAAAGALGLLLFVALVYLLAQRSVGAPPIAAQPRPLLWRRLRRR